MRRKRLILSVALGVLAAGVFFFLLREPSEPVFEGRKLGYWIRRTLESVSTEAELQAERAVKAAGTNALPYLLDQFTRPPPSWNRALNKVGYRLNISRQAETEVERINVAVFGLTALGQDLTPALPALAKQWNSPRRHVAAWILMCQCGEKALPYFREAIQSTNLSTFICRLGQSAQYATIESVPLIEKLLSDPDSEIRRKTLVALTNPNSGSITPNEALIQTLHDTEPEVQIAAAEAWAKIPKPFSEKVVPTLLALMTNSNTRLANAASNAVQRINASAMPSSHP